MKMLARLRRLGLGLCRHEGGNIAMIFGLSLPVLMGGLAATVDLNTWYSSKTRLQEAADGAALAAVRELQIASATSQQISRTAETYARSLLADKGPSPTSITANVSSSNTVVASNSSTILTSSAPNNTVKVDITAAVSPIFSRFLTSAFGSVSVSATARLSGGAPICVIGLDPKSDGTLHFEKKATLTADHCAVYANSASPRGLQGEDGAAAQAAYFCSAGGYSGNRANFNPLPTTDCPVMPDPLATRAAPVYGGCTATNMVVQKTTTSLSPGVYCGGLKVTNKATVTLQPGIYVIKDGPLVVDKKSSFQGLNTGLYFVGDKAGLLFDKDSTISLTAPKDGAMAGILMSEERTVSNPVGPPSPTDLLNDIVGALLPAIPPLPSGAPKMREYHIVSDDARQLLGTIYLPVGRLMIDSSKPVADKSAFTVIVAMRLDLFDGPNLYLNTNYSGTDVPVPPGVGPVASTASLSR